MMQSLHIDHDIIKLCHSHAVGGKEAIESGVDRHYFDYKNSPEMREAGAALGERRTTLAPIAGGSRNNFWIVALNRIGSA